MHLKSLVWRRLIVSETVTLAKLHTAGMGWEGGHQYEHLIVLEELHAPPRSEAITGKIGRGERI